MAKVLKEYFKDVRCADIHDFGYAQTQDFLSFPYPTNSVDWIVTNPPFRLAEDFILRSFDIARHGVAVLVRTVFLESVGRFNRLFEVDPPSVFAQFVERVPMIKGRLDEKATTATGYCWLVWEHSHREQPRLVWIPPCRRKLERPGDYSNPRLVEA